MHCTDASPDFIIIYQKRMRSRKIRTEITQNTLSSGLPLLFWVHIFVLLVVLHIAMVFYLS